MNFLRWDDVQIFTFFFVLLRVTSVLYFVPIFGDKAIAPIIKILFGVSIAAVVHPLLWSQGFKIDLRIVNEPLELLMAVISEVGFGVMLGFVARWIFDAVSFAGHFMATSVGFSMASILDPHTETQNTAYSELYFIITMLLFLSLNGHHIYLSTILDSFRLVPIASPTILHPPTELIEYLISMSAEVIKLGVKLSAPVMIVILIMNITFGLLSRAVPQLNALVVSFAANIVIGLLISLVSMPAFQSIVEGRFDAYYDELLRFMKLYGG